jgi:hypothetical protein
VIFSTDLAELFCRDCIAQQPALKFAFWSGLALAATLFCLWRARSIWLRARLIADLPTSRVRSASQGFTELAGIARSAGTPLASPLTGQPCLWWRYRIERHQSNGRSSSWTTVEKGASEAPLVLDDGSGRCLIWPDGGELHSHRVKRWSGHQRHPLSGGGPGGLLGGIFGGRYRYTEELIADGDPLYVLGQFETDDQGRLADPKRLQAEILRRWKGDYPALLARHDRNADGELDIAEWEAVRAAAADAAREEQRQRGRQAPEHQMRKPEDLPLLISTVPENRLGARLRWQALGFALGFLATGSLATWLVSSRLSG